MTDERDFDRFNRENRLGCAKCVSWTIAFCALVFLAKYLFDLAKIYWGL